MIDFNIKLLSGLSCYSQTADQVPLLNLWFGAWKFNIHLLTFPPGPPQDLFYSRKNFAKPELQDGLHQSFDKEVSHLDTRFPGQSAGYFLSSFNDKGNLYPAYAVKL